MEASALGAIFDWDGVIIDSHNQHSESWAILAKELDIPLGEGFFKATFGMRNDKIIPEFTDWAEPHEERKIAELGDRKEALYRELIRRDGIEPLPGVVALLSELNSAGVPCSVGSSTPHENIRTIMEVTGLENQFQAVTAAEDVSRGKPAPDVFLKAADKVERNPSNCVVFEDAHVGIQAGNAAGAKTIAVSTTHPIDTFHDATLAVESLEHVSLEVMLELFT